MVIFPLVDVKQLSRFNILSPCDSSPSRENGGQEEQRAFFACASLFSEIKYFLWSPSKCVFTFCQPEVAPNSSLASILGNWVGGRDSDGFRFTPWGGHNATWPEQLPVSSNLFQRVAATSSVAEVAVKLEWIGTSSRLPSFRHSEANVRSCPWHPHSSWLKVSTTDERYHPLWMLK